MIQTIVTEHCWLNPLTGADAAELHELWILPAVRKYLWDDQVISLALTKKIINQGIVHLNRSEYGLWGVRLHDSDALIGFGGYWPFHEPSRIELLFGLSPYYWGYGYATEMARALVEYGREILGFKTILASTDLPNIASMAVLKRLGMEQTDYDADSRTCYFEFPAGTSTWGQNEMQNRVYTV